MKTKYAREQPEMLEKNFTRGSAVTESTTDVLDSKKETLRGFFDSIAGRYDFLNQLLSFQLDENWRKRALNLLLEGREETILDLGTGTGKFLNLFLEKQSWKFAAGLDFSMNMLKKAKEELPAKVGLVAGDFHHIPFRSSRFDLIVSSFALRSVQELPLFFKELHRLLTPQGKIGLLCLTRPGNPFYRALVFPYLKFYLPFIGGIFSGNRAAYTFLSESILNFQEPRRTALMLEEAGFTRVQIYPFTMGLATLITAQKRSQ